MNVLLFRLKRNEGRKPPHGNIAAGSLTTLHIRRTTPQEIDNAKTAQTVKLPVEMSTQRRLFD
ncbi:hypothetical protein [Paraburkholderia saeva]|uniref:hypothetical protein n=1 Tax=Paraburkholderia saeva TaxID=2777537 RepID=UPI001E45884C|nr:hypothetical protein [Paraburkholderia saeva]